MLNKKASEDLVKDILKVYSYLESTPSVYETFRDERLNLLGYRRAVIKKFVMYAYEGAFRDEEVQNWLTNQINRQKDKGLGLNAVLLKET